MRGPPPSPRLLKGVIGLMKPKANPQLNYRVEKQVQDAYKQVCKENCLDPGALIRQFMLDIISKYKKRRM
jgi:hypothetical protein